jgi:glycosyltransferase involved in cell wall biosynthesis
MRVCALIPVYNNIDTIAEVVKRCRAVIEPDVIVVSDGSTDGSDKAAARAGAHMVHLEKNQIRQGYGIHTRHRTRRGRATSA